MCLGIPGKVIEVYEEADLRMGKVEFGGILKDVCLAFVPDAEVGHYVLVHVGFAISRIDEAEAAEVFSFLEQIESMKSESGNPKSQTNPKSQYQRLQTDSTDRSAQ